MLLALLSQPIDEAPEAVASVAVAWSAVAPILALVGGALLLLTADSLSPRSLPKGVYAIWTTATASAAIAFAVPLWQRVQDADRGPFSTLATAIGVDGFSLFATFTICAAVILGAMLMDDWLRREGMEGAEPYVLMLLSASGGVMMASANDLIVMFLGLEILSIAVYVLAAMHLRKVTSQEAGVKYFVLGAFSSAFFLYGIALTYGGTGTTNLVEISTFLASTVLTDTGLVLAGLALLLVGFAFKVAAVPFHFWTPDVYQGAPSPSVAWMASGVKVAGFAGLLRVFYLAFGTYSADWQPIVYAVAAITMVVGNLVALAQKNIKRMLAYSSIAHAGYLLVAILARGNLGSSAFLFYLFAYTLATFGAFAVVVVLSGRGDRYLKIEDYAGLWTVRPWLAGSMAVFMLALLGFPIFGGIGFFAKWYMLQAALDSITPLTNLAVLLVLTSVISAGYYLHVVLVMFMKPVSRAESEPQPAGRLTQWVIAAAAVLILAFGIFPDPVARLARSSVIVPISR